MKTQFGRGEAVPHFEACPGKFSIPSGRGSHQCVDEATYNAWKRSALSGDFLGDVVDAAGKIIGGGIHAVGEVGEGIVHEVNDLSTSIRDNLSKVPVVGGPLGGIWTGLTGQLDLADAILSGQRIDRALVEQFQKQVSAAQAVAPWAQAVISFVPGIGPIASAAISAGLALAQGKTIDQAMIEAVAAAIPGGALVKSAFNVARKFIVDGKLSGLDLVNATLGAIKIPIPDAVKPIFAVGLDMTRQLADGKPLDEAMLQVAAQQLPTLLGTNVAKDLLEKANGIGVDLAGKMLAQTKIADTLTNLKKLVPSLPSIDAKELGNALSIGITVGSAQKIQRQMAVNASDPFARAQAQAEGQLKAIGDIVTHAARNQSGDPSAFDLGTGLLEKKLSPVAYQAVRSSLSGKQKTAFDAAAALKVGRVAFALPQASNVQQATAQAAYLTTLGAIHNPDRANLVSGFVKSSEGRAGLDSAVKTAEHSRNWFIRFLEALGLWKS